jgi:hypothetical protein
LLLCAFHILQAFWRFLWDNKTGVKKEARQQLFALLKSMLYATTEEQLDVLFTITALLTTQRSLTIPRCFRICSPCTVVDWNGLCAVGLTYQSVATTQTIFVRVPCES